MRDFYDTLGVACSANPEEIKVAFRRLATQYHPDKNPSADAHMHFMEIREAYEILSNPVARESFDHMRQEQLVENPNKTALAVWTNYIKNLTA